MVVEHQPHCRHDILEIGERLAHAHHHHVADRPVFGHSAAQAFVGNPQLADDFLRRQVAVEALATGGAERALQRAARLRRDAQRAPLLFRDEYRLDRIAGADVEQPFAGAVGDGGIAQNPRRGNTASRASASRSAFDMSVIAPNSSTPAWCIQRISCFARKGFSPSPAQ